MTCHRCRGFMVPERFEHTSIDSGEARFEAWRCVNCGEITDPVIAERRRAVPEYAASSRPSLRAA